MTSFPISGRDFILEYSGNGDPLPIDLKRYLLERDARSVVTVSHPLQALPQRRGIAESREHVVETHLSSGSRRSGHFRFHRPPYTYPLDVISPIRIPGRFATFFGFNNLAASRGLWMRRRGKVETVVYWAIDYVDGRFGDGALTRCYDLVDRFACSKVDLRVELSEEGLIGRSNRLDVSATRNSTVIPIGTWQGDVAQARWGTGELRLTYFGGLEERQGVMLLPEICSELQYRGVSATLDIVGTGTLHDRVIERSQELGVQHMITAHGFVEDRVHAEAIIASAVVGLAPFLPDPTQFTRSTDPAKLKAYMGAGLPTVMTAEPPNAPELESRGCVLTAPFDARAFVDAIQEMTRDEQTWSQFSESNREHAAQYDWNILFDGLFHKLASA